MPLVRATKSPGQTDVDQGFDHLGEGTVTETEVGDEESYYEIEVTFADGRKIDIQVDENFEVVDTN